MNIGREVTGPQSRVIFTKEKAAFEAEFNRRARNEYLVKDNYFDNNRNLARAFDESFRDDGSVDLDMIKFVSEKGGYRGVNDFINSVHEARLFSRGSDPIVRKRFLEWLDKIEAKHGQDLFSPQRGMIKSWRSENYVAP